MSIPTLGTSRPLIVQTFNTRQIAVTAAALPIDPTLDKTKLITGFSISNPSTGVSVFIGNPGITTATGFEIPAGTAPFFGIEQVRQMYELQRPTDKIIGAMECSPVPLEGLPFVVFDLSQFFIIAGGATTVTLITFPAMWL